MPLDHSSSDPAFKRNVKTLMGEVGSSPHVKSRDQALAIAYDIKRRGRAAGGVAPWQIRNEARGMQHSPALNVAMPKLGALPHATMAAPKLARGPGLPGIPKPPHMAEGGTVHVGPIVSAVPGRTDRHDMKLESGSYVIPAQAVSHLGQSNTLAGFKALDRIVARIHTGHGLPAPKVGRAHGGNVGTDPVDVVTAGGEYVFKPETCRLIGAGDVTRGHEKLDRWVNKIKADHIKTLKRLPGPAKS